MRRSSCARQNRPPTQPMAHNRCVTSATAWIGPSAPSPAVPWPVPTRLAVTAPARKTRAASLAGAGLANAWMARITTIAASRAIHSRPNRVSSATVCSMSGANGIDPAARHAGRHAGEPAERGYERQRGGRKLDRASARPSARRPVRRDREPKHGRAEAAAPAPRNGRRARRRSAHPRPVIALRTDVHACGVPHIFIPGMS